MGILLSWLATDESGVMAVRTSRIVTAGVRGLLLRERKSCGTWEARRFMVMALLRLKINETLSILLSLSLYLWRH